MKNFDIIWIRATITKKRLLGFIVMREQGRKFEVPEDILWYIESIKRDKRRISHRQRLELVAMLIDAWVELQKRGRK